jgi:hypothetical protein
MKNLKLLHFLIVSFFIITTTPSWACISFPKNVKLKNSPFPFSEFDIFASSFTYKTSDGDTNRLNCEVNGGYSWSIDSYSESGDKSSYDYNDIKNANIYVDGNEEGQRTTLVMGNTGDMAYASIKKKGEKSSLQIVCSKEGNIRKLTVKVINSEGNAIGEISSMKDMNAPVFRSISVPKKENGAIDFASNQQVGGEFMSSGCGSQKQINSTTTPAGASQ